MPKSNRTTEEIREELIMAAIKLFAQNGVMKTSIKNIAQIVGITRQSATHHFPRKDDILKIILEKFDQLINQSVLSIQEIKNNNTENPEAILLKLFFTLKKEDEEIYRNIIKIIYKDQFYSDVIKKYIIKIIVDGEKRIEECFIALIEKGVLKTFDTKIIASMMYKIINTYAELAVLTDWEYDKNNQMIEDMKVIINMVISQNKI